MAITFTEQGNIPPASASSLTADGEGMHSYFPYDLVRGLNNLGTYVNNHLHYVQGWANSTSETHGRFVSAVSTTGEHFLAQFPVFVPLWAVRMVWTAGARNVSGTSMTNVKVYLSRTAYIGNRSTAFDATTLASGYKSRTVTVSLSAGAYSLADDSSTGITPIDDNVTRKFSPGIGRDTKRTGYAIITGTGTSSTVAVEDFSLWFLPS